MGVNSKISERQGTIFRTVLHQEISLKCVPHDTTTVNQQKMLSSYLRAENCKITAKGVLSKGTPSAFITRSPSRPLGSTVPRGSYLGVGTRLKQTDIYAYQNPSTQSWKDPTPHILLMEENLMALRSHGHVITKGRDVARILLCFWLQVYLSSL